MKVLESVLFNNEENLVIIFELFNWIGNNNNFLDVFEIFKYRICEIFDFYIVVILGVLGIL